MTSTTMSSRLNFTKSVMVRSAVDHSTEQHHTYNDDASNWRKIIFLPHQMLWRMMMVTTILIDCCIVTYSLNYSESLSLAQIVLYYMCECMYFVDVVLTILHKYMTAFRQTEVHLPKNTYFMVIDVFTLLPYYEIYYLLRRTSKGKASTFKKDYVKAKVFFRITYVILFIRNISNIPGLNHILVATVVQFVIFYLYQIIASSLFFSLKVKKEDRRKWTDNLKWHNFNNESMFQWYIMTNTLMGNLLAHNWTGIIKPENFTEEVLFMLTMLFGFLMHIMIFFGQLMALYMKKMGDQFHFSSKLGVIGRMLDDWDVSRNTKEEVIEKYNKLWEKMYGNKVMPSSFHNLPKSLRGDCAVDIFWYCFKHSYLLRDLDFPVLKNLSLRMKHEFYMPGEYLYKCGQFKTKMYYIVTGVVEVVGGNERSSSMISFSDGTVLGEISCLMALKSIVTLRCATYTNVQSVDMKSLSRLMIKHEGVNKEFNRKLNSRLQLAREMQNSELVKFKSRAQKRTSVKWIKQQWRSTYSENKSKSKAKTMLEEKYQQITEYHTSRFLGLYVLSDDVEMLKKRVICLRPTCPYLLEPSSSFKKFCDYLVLATIIVQSLVLPYLCFFFKRLNAVEDGWLYMLDVIFIFGLYLDMSTAVKTHKKTLMKVSEIFIYKSKQFTTWVDIFSTIPLEMVASLMGLDSRSMNLFRLNRVLRVYIVFLLIQRAELNVWIGYIRIRLVKYFLLFSYSIYFASCVVYGTTCFWKCSRYGWMSYNAAIYSLIYPNSTGFKKATQFLLSLDYTATRILSLTWGHTYSYSVGDIILEYFLILWGYYLFSFCFAELAACTVLQLEVRVMYQQYIKDLKNFAFRSRIPPELKRFMYNMVRCHWDYNRRYQITGKNSIINDMPENLKDDILTCRIIRCLKSVPFFLEVEDEFIRSVANIANLNVFPPSTIILREDIPGTVLHVIVRGYCTAESSIPTDKYHKYVTTYTNSDCFPIMELLLGVNSFLKVVSVTTVELISINLRDLLVCIRSREQLNRDLEKVLSLHMSANYIVLTRKKGRLPALVSGQKSKGKSDYFGYDINDKIKDDDQKIIFKKAFDKLGIWSNIRYFLLTKTIDPTGKFFSIWEIFRGIVSILYVLYVTLLMKFLLRRRNHSNTIIVRCFDSILTLDMYVRLHVQYYDERGIQITHPLYTAYHYLTTSFFIDVLCVLPFDDLQLHRLFGTYRKQHILMLMYILIKPLTLHRVFNGLDYVQEVAREGRARLYQNFKYFGLVVTVTLILASILEIVTCGTPSSSPEVFYNCTNETWIKQAISKAKINDLFYTPSIIAIYTIISIISTCTVGLYTFETSKDFVVIFMLIPGLYALRWFLLGKITSSMISGNNTLVHYQHNMKVFVGFMKKHSSNTNLLQETVSHYEFVWKRTKGYNTTKSLSSFHKVLRGDLTFYLYSSALKMSYLFSNSDSSTIRFVSSYFEELLYKKDANIIRCNDVSNYIYVVYKGYVNVTVANDKLCTLSIGGMFGCFSPIKNTRQTINVTAKVNVHLLRIDNVKFNEHVSTDAKIKQKLSRERMLRTEYILPVNHKSGSKIDLISEASVNTRHIDLHSLKSLMILPTNPYYVVYSYVTSVHLATWSTLYVLTIVATMSDFFRSREYRIYVYCLDVFFFIRIIIGLHVTYMDQDSGLFVTNYSKIWRTYMRSLSGFWLDLLSLIPFELIASHFVPDRSLLKYFLLNRILRIFFMLKYYVECRNTLTVSWHLRWTVMMYALIVLLHLNVSVWWLIACPRKQCSYYERVSHEPLIKITENSTMKSFRLAYLYVTNVFTSTGLKFITPTSNQELVATIVMICVAQYILIYLTAEFASMLVQSKSVMTKFEREAKHVLKYLESADLSLSLKNKVWDYYIVSWTRARGPWIPKLISEAPDYIKQDIMRDLFGRLINDHFLFKRTHIDFQRQLVALFDVCVFLPGMHVVQKGDVDNCMYFIDEGEIVVYDTVDKKEVERSILGVGESFGEAQGLFGVPHDKSYKARFTTKMVILNKERWWYLLDWFPASKEHIEEQAARKLESLSIETDCSFNLS